MKKMFVGILWVIISMELSAQIIAADLTLHTLSLGASIGVLSGRSEEIVYRDGRTRDKLSQLLWDFKPLVYLGVDVLYGWQKPENQWGLFARTSFKFGIPGNSGVMEDRDWVALDYPDFLTHYSVHNNRTETAVLIDADIGASFQIFNQFLLKPFISYSFMSFAWRAKGGSILYPNSNGGHMYLRAVDVITYQQNWNIISPGIAFYGVFNRYFSGEITLKMSPLVWCVAYDNHILRNLTIKDRLDIGFFIEPGLFFSFTPTDLFSLSLSVLYRNISYIRGDETRKQQGQPTAMVRNDKGAGYSAFDIGLTAKFSLFNFRGRRQSQ